MPTHLKSIEPAPSAVETQSRFVTLAGNPNSGKTSLFNALTGAHQHVGNYPGRGIRSLNRREGMSALFEHLLTRRLLPLTLLISAAVFPLTACSKDPDGAAG